MTAPKTFGQIAFEASFDFAASAEVWTNQGEGNKAHWERIGAAIALECSRICTEIAAAHMRQAKDFEYSSMCDHSQQAAIECAEAIREAISCSSKEAP